MIDEIIDQQLSAAVISHVYCSCGSLSNDQPYYRYLHLPKNQQIFDVASLTKPLVTLPLLVDGYLSGKLKVNWTLARWLARSPLALNDSLLRLSIAELISHRTGLAAWHNFWLPTLGQRTLSLSEVLTILNRCSIGDDKSYLYSDLNYILLGIALAQVSDVSLSELFSDFLKKLKLSPKNFCGFASADGIDNAITTAYCHIRNRWLRGEVHDENCAAIGGVSGHAGLFSSGDDLIAYLRRLFTHQVGIEIIRRNNECRFGLMRENYATIPVLGHLGFTGCAFWIDATQGNYALLLTNRTLNSRLVDSFPETRRKIFDKLFTIMTP